MNRAAFASFGFSGSKDKLVNRMVNPCDDKRFIYFFCDMPHLLKTIRNNLLLKKQFLLSTVHAVLTEIVTHCHVKNIVM